ncbi:2-dehydro-3-deoxygalactonokinase [Devosia ginsengisoli]|uniref:2-dehydro-3-deoxygalactonokinase n=1 Tax=Devosia ginsengisoli TaxID=400770 RepID=A0A5B8LRV9_9HYPH|nr:2-dehydro-3-deoxygalactonokinase [Devosia ginsengisoli]QDZ10374.1 2-dehydro-3-deoxygalactonokinase [Devosia ginsengisoli]
MSEIVDWVAVDWGTSNLRAWGIGPNGAVTFKKTSPKGMGKLAREEFPAALDELLDNVAPARSGPLDVLICGMAGARQGWLEAPYLEAPTDLRGLLDGAVRPTMPDPRIAPAILPGVCQKAGADNVMRGEETQLLGLAALTPGFSGVVCMPGTHSKWAQLSGTRIEQFSTAMTGEMFEVLRTHSVLRHSLTGDLDGPGRAEGFAAGAAAGLDHPEQLLGTLFQVRAGSLLSGRQPDWCAGYLSGLLVGTEIGSNRHLIGDQPVPLIGSPALSALYAQVLAMAGARGEPMDATAIVLAGLKAARSFAA